MYWGAVYWVRGYTARVGMLEVLPPPSGPTRWPLGTAVAIAASKQANFKHDASTRFPERHNKLWHDREKSLLHDVILIIYCSQNTNAHICIYMKIYKTYLYKNTQEV